jgi:hypothetical protein
MTNHDEHVLDRLSDYLDGMDAAPDEVCEHLQVCLACKKHFQELERIADALEELPEPDVSPAFATGVMNRIAKEPKKTARRIVLFSPRILAMAAGILVLIAVGLIAVRSQIVQPDNTAVSSLSAVTEEMILAELAQRVQLRRVDVPEWLANPSSDEEEDPHTALTSEEWLDSAIEMNWFSNMVDDWESSENSDDSQTDVFDEDDTLDNWTNESVPGEVLL